MMSEKIRNLRRDFNISQVELAKQVDEEVYEVFLEYRWKMKEVELNRLIEESLISKEELEAEM